MLDSLARFIAARSRRVLVVAFVLVAIAGALGGPVAGLLDSDGDFDDPAADAVVAAERLRDASGASATPDFIALVRDASPDRVDDVRRALEDAPGVASVADPEVRSRDGDATYLVATFSARAPAGETALDLEERLDAIPGVVSGGGALAQEQVGEQVSEDLARAEMLAFPILFLLSLWVFRGLVAALLPLGVGAATVLTTFLAMRGVDAGVTGLSIFALNLVIGLGLGLAIDYSLFMVTRFREELERAAGDRVAALRTTMATAGRTVLFSAVTVSAALASLIVFPQRFLYSMGIGGAIVALVAALVSLTLLPALLVALGPRVNALAPRRWQRRAHDEAAGVRAGFWYRLSQLVMKRAGLVAVAATLLLVLVGLPFAGIKFTGVDAGVLPTSQSARVVDDALRAEFPPNRTTPVTVALRGTDRAAVDAYAARLREVDGVREVTATPVGSGGTTFRVDAFAAGRPLDEAAKDAVRDIRDVRAPGSDPVVGGETAEFLDQQASLVSHLPIALAVLAVTTLLILFLMTGSVVLPLKTLVMNLLTLSAAFGLLVLIFQDGRLEGLLDYTSQGALESSQPILLFAIAFGLSTDYGVFLLTRIKEARDAGASETESVAIGLEKTGRVVTAAALLFVVAIGAFSTSEIIFIKELGVGTALAVIIDATIVRALLVPSLMRLLGRWNWWAPRPLARLHGRFGISERPVASPAAGR